MFRITPAAPPARLGKALRTVALWSDTARLRAGDGPLLLHASLIPRPPACGSHWLLCPKELKPNECGSSERRTNQKHFCLPVHSKLPADRSTMKQFKPRVFRLHATVNWKANRRATSIGVWD